MSQNLGNLFIDGESVIEDENGNHSITNNGVDLNTSDYRFGASSLEFSGNTDKLIITDSDDFNFGTGNFTIDCWIKVALTDSYHTIYEQRGTGIDDIDIFIEGSVYNEDRLVFTSRVDGSKIAECKTPINSITANTWHHIAVVKYGTELNELKIFIDGVDQTLTWNNNMLASTSFPNIPNDPTVGYGVSTAQSLNGLMDNFRLTKGEALWTEEFSLTEEALLYTGSGSIYVRPDTISGLYNIVSNIRGKAKEGFVRPTLKQMFMSYPDYEEIESSSSLSFTDPLGDSSVVYALDFEDNVTEQINSASPIASVGTPVYVLDKNSEGKALQVTSDTAVSYTPVTTLSFPFTVTLWVSVGATGSILDNNYRQINLYTNGQNLYTANIGKQFYDADSISQFNETGWNHIVYVFNSEDAVTRYINNNKTVWTSPTHGGMTGYTTSNICVGARRDDRDTFFRGSMDKYRIFNKALNDTEVQTLYDEFTG